MGPGSALCRRKSERCRATEVTDSCHECRTLRCWTCQHQCVHLRLVERVKAPHDDRRLWYPFQDAVGYHRHWWLRPASDRHRYFSVMDDGSEVARVELDERVWTDDYPGAPTGHDLLEIQFLEVREDCRLRVLGTAIVAMISTDNPGRTLVAFPSEEAESFWEGHLRWDRFDDPETPMRAPLMVNPDWAWMTA